MAALAARHPAYGWTHNVGYGTGEHRRALALAGLTPHHRRSFGPVAQLALDLALPAPPPDGPVPPDAAGLAADVGAGLLAPVHACDARALVPHPDQP